MYTKKTNHALLILFFITSIMLVSCAAPEKSEKEIAAEQTLSAIYAQQTAQAAAVPEPVVEEAPIDAEEPEPVEEPEATWLEPGEIPEVNRTLADSNSSYNAWEHKATQGDNFLDSLYERPFTSEVMDYRPDLDITEVDFAPGEYYLYFTIRLYGMNMDGGGLKGMYGIEFDRTLTGRGDLLVWVSNPAKEWTTADVTVYLDDNRDVGGLKPLVAETGFNGSGYDLVHEMNEIENAYARIDPEDGNAVQIAVSYSLLGTPDEFLWGAWADDGLVDPAQFDYNDRMGPSAAGSPILGEDYPVKELYNLDNTCRLPYGLPQTGLVTGMCKIGLPPTSEPGSGPTCRRVCLRPCLASVGCCEWGEVCN